MRQTFTFADSKHKPEQALAALKNKVRKYLKRERRKSLPEGADYWDFDCQVGETEGTSEALAVTEVITRMGDIFERGEPQVYIEILARAETRKPREGSPKN